MESEVSSYKEKVVYEPKVAKDGIVYDFGLKFGLIQVLKQKKRKRDENEIVERKRVSFVHDQNDIFYGLFDEKEADFEIAIDNTSDHDVCFGVNLVGNEEIKEFVIEGGESTSMKALESGGKHLRFVSQVTDEGRLLVETAAAEQKISLDQASRNCSRIIMDFNIKKTEEEEIAEVAESKRRLEEFEKAYNNPEAVLKRKKLEEKWKELEKKREMEQNEILKPITDRLEKKYIEQPDKSNITVILATLTGKMLEIETNLNSTIGHLKELIMKSESIPIDQQRLIFESKQLEDVKILNDCGIKNASFLKLVLRLRGGGGPPPKKCCKADVSVEGIGERGVVCFGEETDQEFDYCDEPFQSSKKYVVKGFIVELRTKSQFNSK